jgi:hypothetical protein
MGTTLDTLRKAIMASKMTRYRLSMESGIDQGQLSRLVSGERCGMTLDSAERIAKALGLRIVVAKAKGRKTKGA